MTRGEEGGSGRYYLLRLRPVPVSNDYHPHYQPGLLRKLSLPSPPNPWVREKTNCAAICDRVGTPSNTQIMMTPSAEDDMVYYIHDFECAERQFDFRASLS